MLISLLSCARSVHKAVRPVLEAFGSSVQLVLSTTSCSIQNVRPLVQTVSGRLLARASAPTATQLALSVLEEVTLISVPLAKLGSI